ncbi:MAG: MFS transporter [Actinomycetota bacterium]|nr:MFS transporter [Actinomycetota bacterium]
MTTTTAGQPATSAPTPRRGLWNRELAHYPGPAMRFTSLAIVVVATIILYYEFYLAGAVAAHIITQYHMSFVYYVNISVIGYVLGAVASFLAGVADRYGRANIVVVGLIITGLLSLVGIPNAHSKLAFGILFVAIGFVEGVILVATPALIRDFSPQLGRASAMGFWTLGPVMGSLVVSIAVSNTSDTTPWQDQYIACGIVGLVVAGIALFGLRELAPVLRDQLMVSSHDRALIEARAKGIDVEASLRHPFRQMLKLDIIGSAFAISVFLIIYYIAVGFFPIYFQTVFGFSQHKANALGNWNWAFNAIGLVVIGVVSDRVRVRKPFMIVGSIGAIIFTILFLSRATHPATSYSTFVWILVGLSLSLGVAYAPWMASFTETVERRNPALTATGLAVWGLIIRIVIAVSVFFVPHVVNTVTTLVDRGSTVQAAAGGLDPKLSASENAAVKAVAADPTIVTKTQTLATQYQAQLGTAAKIDAATQAALAANPADQAAQVKALSEISGLPAADVGTVATLFAQHAPALAAGQAVDPTTQVALLTNPTDQVAAAKAVQEVVAKLGITPAEALARLQDLRSIPVAQLLLVQQDGTKVQDAVAQLTALAKVPAADLLFLKQYGTALQDPKVQASLKYLQANAGAVQKAAKDSPKQWQKYFWIAVGGEIVFIPLIFVMAGFWDPRKARKQELEHEQWVAAELAKLNT